VLSAEEKEKLKEISILNMNILAQKKLDDLLSKETPNISQLISFAFQKVIA
jgi:hypothetical protein